ncbi:probable ATP-dependent RNA helicase DDX46 [Paramacrobiotus metropolitanus]|uniref:probable ATP-dependent RNA helicase DDX46 n=1 Tax=Paramacrobiotus metropolitanus TaxID=2943436 RepID=UPI002445EB0A|nr:probable ATP-dependent RNA helicase DDX46 [Paramacrobiotus metropolitanus]
MPRLVSSTSLRDSRREDRLREERNGRYDDRRRRSRSRDRYNNYPYNDRNRRRSRSRSPYSRRRRSRSRSAEAQPAVVPVAATVDSTPLTFGDTFDKEAEVKRLEQEYQKRKERIELWRKQKKREDDKAAAAAAVEAAKQNSANGPGWSLEDEGEDAEEPLADVKAKPVEDEVDPLDAFMQGVQEEVKEIRKRDLENMQDAPGKKKSAARNEAASGVTFVNTVANKNKNDHKSKRGEIMEQDQDALEWSSEEEEEDLKTTMSNVQNKQKKLIQAVDHQAIDYPTFRRSFYNEVPEITNMSEVEVQAYREELEDIKVRGKDCPKPIKNWAQCGVSKKELDVLKKSGYTKPTPIQAQAVPCIMSGRDVIGIAKTGSGKTLAFLLPMFRHVLDQPHLEEGEGPVALILTPTRELALQIWKEAKKFGKSMGLRCVCVYGGTGISEQIAELKKGAEIIVCTPGRMIDMLAANNGRVTNLRRVTYVVLDEADRMFDMGFEPQVMLIVDNIRPDRQTVLFSATFPRQMEALARRILAKPIEIQVGGRSVVCKDVEQHVMIIDEDQKFLKVLELLGHYGAQGSCLIFVEKQEKADQLLKDLMKASYSAMALHGGIDQFDRDSTINDFKKGNIQVLVATSVAARGLDVKNLVLVVNYDCPNHYEDYVHRCGRTGRAGNKGYAYTFITPLQERYSPDILKALELSGAEVPQDLKLIFETYKGRLAAEGKKVKGFSGFGGKGFQFDENEAQAAKDSKKMQKAVLGLQDSDSDEGEADLDQHIEDLFKSTRRVKDANAPAPPVVIVQQQPAVTVQQGAAAPVQPQETYTGHGAFIPVAAPVYKVSKDAGKNLELAKRLAMKLQAAKAVDPTKNSTQQAAEAIMRGFHSEAPAVSKKTIAEQLAEKLNAKLNYVPEEKPAEENPVEQYKTFEEELEINDFPQQARWRITGKETLAQIGEYADAFLSVRGSYIPTGKEPTEGERKLYIGIEATTELSLSKAKAEVTRIIKEELLKIANAPVNRGRYKVV